MRRYDLRLILLGSLPLLYQNIMISIVSYMESKLHDDFIHLIS